MSGVPKVKVDVPEEEEVQHPLVHQLTAKSPKFLAPSPANQRSVKCIEKFRNVNTKNKEGIFSVGWAPDGRCVAACTGDNKIVVLRTNGAIEKSLSGTSETPICSSVWRPTSSLITTQGVLVTGDGDGNLTHWHVPTGKVTNTIKEKDNEIYALDYRTDGQKFASAGKDMAIRVYDEATKQKEVFFEQGVLQQKGHSNRIFAVKFHPTDPNLIFSASWDRNVMMWDVRSGENVRSIYGPYVCGDALQIYKDSIVTGSWRRDETIETWDIGTGKKLKTVNFSAMPMIYSLKPHPKIPGVFLAAGTGVNVLRIFDINSEFKSEPVKLPNGKGIYSADFDKHGDFVAFGGDSPMVAVKRVILPRTLIKEP